MNIKTVVIGLGNTLQTDEGIGVHVVNYLKTQNHMENIEYIDGGTMSFNLVAPIESADRLIVVDTAELNAQPGSVKVFEGTEMDTFVACAKKTSAHEVGLKDALSIALLEGRLPAHRALVGIQPKQFGWGDWPTDEVARAIPVACQKVFEISQGWKT
jgi:hydrogenase maturation protease